MRALFFSRARLRRDVPAAALWRELTPQDDDKRVSTSHRLVWTLFADSPDRERDFLWREAAPGTFYFLSGRVPEDRHNLFEIDPAKPFNPQLRAGDTLQFSLRANATVAHKPEGASGDRVRGKPSDVVMDALYRIPKGREREAARSDAVATAGINWLRARQERSGFRLPDGTMDTGVGCLTSYRVLQLDHRNSKMRLGVLDFDGRLVVEDPASFLDAIARGFGRGKAFGCGLMMIRRA
jgi:CRISPR system Cascade subunit CasE